MKITIVLPWSFRFDVVKPRSIETVIRTINAGSRYRDTITVIADAGASDHGPMRTRLVDGQGGRWDRTRCVTALLRDNPPDLLELHQHVPTARRIAAALPGVPAILYRHNATKPKWGPVEGIRQAWLQRPFQARVYVSAFAANAYRARFPALADTTFAVPNPIDPTHWRHPVDHKEPLIAYAGRAAPEKGLAELCAALAEVLPIAPDWRAEILASHWHKHSKWAEVAIQPLHHFGDRATVRRDQPLAAVQDTLKRAAIVVVPSRYEEPFGLAALEAHAAGAAVISSGSGGLREASGPHAHYIDPVTPKTIAEAITALINHPEQRRTLASAGQAFVLQTHTPAQRAAELDALRGAVVVGTPITAASHRG